MKAYFDAMGHYSRWDAVSLNVSEESLDPIREGESHSTNLKREEEREPLSLAKVQEVAEEYAVSIDTVEGVISAIQSSQ